MVQTILTQQLHGLDQLFIKKQTSRVVAIRKGELAATLNSLSAMDGCDHPLKN
jgi:hypothetical protein